MVFIEIQLSSKILNTKKNILPSSTQVMGQLSSGWVSLISALDSHPHHIKSLLAFGLATIGLALILHPHFFVWNLSPISLLCGSH